MRPSPAGPEQRRQLRSPGISAIQGRRSRLTHEVDPLSSHLARRLSWKALPRRFLKGLLPSDHILLSEWRESGREHPALDSENNKKVICSNTNHQDPRGDVD